MGSELDSVGDLAASGIISLSTGPFGSALHKYDYRESGRPVVPAEAISDGDLDSNKLNYIDETKAAELTRYFLEPGDLVFARRGAQACGHSAYVTPVHNGSVAGTGLLYARVLKKDVLDPLYFFLAMSSPESVRWLKNHAIGATMPNLNTGIISSTPFRIIPLEQQQEIISNYVPLRNKLSLLAEMNATLEGMAQALFKSWFVDFDPVIDNALAAGNPIPDELAPRAEVRKKARTTQQDSVDHPTLSDPKPLFPAAFQFTEELGWIPEGWTLQSFESLATLDTESVKPFEQPSAVWEHYSIPSYDSTGMPSWDRGDEFKSNKYRVKPGAILSSKLNPETERTWWPFMLDGEAAICSTEFMQFVPTNQDEQAFVYSLIRSEPFQANILERVTGSTGSRQRAQPKEIAKIGILDCGGTLRSEFTNVANPLFQSARNNSLRTQTLTKLRDTLLPKLIAGEVPVSEAKN